MTEVSVEGGQIRVHKVTSAVDPGVIVNPDGVVAQVGIGAGGVAATPARAVQAEAVLRGQPWTLETAQKATAALRSEFQPISDMRASSAYRSEVLGNLMQRFWLESQGLEQINLESFRLVEATTP